MNLWKARGLFIRNAITSGLVAVGIMGVYSFFLYTLSFIPFLGLHFNHYYGAFLFVLAVSCCIGLALHIYYYFYDKLKPLRMNGFKYIIAFLFSFMTIHYASEWIDDGHIQMVTKFILSLAVSLTFYDDPKSIRSMNRTIKNHHANKKDRP